MPKINLDINRPLTGFLCLGLLGLGSICWGLDIGSEMFIAGLIRTGLFLAALWWALPTKNREAAWEGLSWGNMIPVLLAIIVFVSARFKLRWTAIPLVLGFALAVFLLNRPIKRR